MICPVAGITPVLQQRYFPDTPKTFDTSSALEFFYRKFRNTSDFYHIFMLPYMEKGSEVMRLLVVEDDHLLNNTLCYNLSAAGYTVDAAMTKTAAVSFCEAQDYDLIILDINLPDGNGFDLCEKIKERRPDTSVIFSDGKRYGERYAERL